MKTQTLAILGALAITAQARDIWAPDKSALIEAGSSVALVDGKTDLTLIHNANLAKKIEVSWSPDSKKVLVIESFARGSGVFGAYHDNYGWHKVSEPDSDMAKIAGESNGGIIAESRSLKEWNEIQGDMTFRNGRCKRFKYSLRWTPEGLTNE